MIPNKITLLRDKVEWGNQYKIYRHYASCAPVYMASTLQRRQGLKIAKAEARRFGCELIDESVRNNRRIK